MERAWSFSVRPLLGAWLVALVGTGAGWALPPPASNYEVALSLRSTASMTVAGVLTIGGLPAPDGSEIAVVDPRGTVCGSSGVETGTADGSTFLIQVYGDDDTVDGLACFATDGTEPLAFEVRDADGHVYGQGSLRFAASPWEANGATPLPTDPGFQDRMSYAVALDASNRPPQLAGALPTPSVQEADQVVIGVLPSYEDPEGEAMTVVIDAQPAHHLGAALVPAPDGTLTYLHDGSETLTDSFRFHVTDASGNASEAQTVDITIVPVDDPPTAAGFSVAVGEGGSVSVDALDPADPKAADPDTPLAELTVVLETGAGKDPLNGTVTLAGSTFTYSHDGSETETDSFWFHVTDGSADSTSVQVTVSVAPVNDAPTAAPFTLTVSEGGSVSIDVLDAAYPKAGDVDDPLESLTVVLETGPGKDPLHGTVRLSGSSFTYAHDGSETTADAFWFHVSDGSADSSSVQATVAVTPVNDPPRLEVSGATTVEEEQPLVLNLSAEDPEGGHLTFSVSGAPSGSVLTDNQDGTASFSWAPPLGARGGYPVEFTVTDDGAPAEHDELALQLVVTGPVVTVVVDLLQGWNLISFPVAACFYTEGSTPPQVLPSGMEPSLCQTVASVAQAFPLAPAAPGETIALEQVRSFADGSVYSYDSAFDSGLNDVTWVAGGYGYLVKVSAPGTVTFTGERLAPTATLALSPGWNLVGYWGDGARYVTVDPTTADAGLFPAGTSATQVTSVPALFQGLGSAVAALKSEDKNGPHAYSTAGGGDLDYAGPGYGYWVKLTAAATLSYGP